MLSAKFVRWFCIVFRLGAGGAWPGEIALRISPEILSFFSRQPAKGVILVAGTNGKTTTTLMIERILKANGESTIHNSSGANLDNGIASAFIQRANFLGKINADWGIFEIDENTLSVVLPSLKPKVVLLLNLFRDQLDRYGEVDVIAEKWERALRGLPRQTIVISNSDDPQMAHLGKIANLKNKVIFFGIDEPKYFISGREHATDSTFCLNCGGRLKYKGIYYSHIGIWRCERCGEKRPNPQLSKLQSPLPGLYNLYNTLAAVSVAKARGVRERTIKRALEDFAPAFGRQEKFKVKGKKVKIFLSKNPVGFNVSLKTILEFKPKVLLLVLNDRIPDGRDVSWIWDVDFEMIPSGTKVIVSGERAFDLALRIKYASNIEEKNLIIEPNLDRAIRNGTSLLIGKETLYILPTYSAMLEVRKLTQGRKIL